MCHERNSARLAGKQCLIPIGSMGLVYLLTFAIKINQMYPNVGKYTIHGSHGIGCGLHQNTSKFNLFVWCIYLQLPFQASQTPTFLSHDNCRNGQQRGHSKEPLMKVIQWLWSKMGKTGPFMLLYYVKVHNWRDPDVDVISWTQVQRRTGTKMMCLAAVHMINGGTRQLPSSLPKLCSATWCDAKKQNKNRAWNTSL